MLSLDKIPNQIGFLIMNDEGAVLSSAGDLENDEHSAEIIMKLLNLTSQIDPVAFPNTKGFKKLTITYENHCYVICLSNRKIYVVKRMIQPIISTVSTISSNDATTVPV